MISGSNMSGKSTLVARHRHQCGAGHGWFNRARKPHAVYLRLNVGASINISDSLQKGVSHFYAEISRIRAVVDLAEPGASCFFFSMRFCRERIRMIAV